MITTKVHVWKFPKRLPNGKCKMQDPPDFLILWIILDSLRVIPMKKEGWFITSLEDFENPVGALISNVTQIKKFPYYGF